MPPRITKAQKRELVRQAAEALMNPHAKAYPNVYAAAALTAGNNLYSAINYFLG